MHVHGIKHNLLGTKKSIMRFLRDLFFLSAIVSLISACSKTADLNPAPIAATAGMGYEADTSQETSTPLELRGFCDASAAVSLAPGIFIVANDEDNILRVYKPDTSQEPIYTFDLDSFLAVTTKNSEADIEGATRIGANIYWITSHGTNKDGKVRPNRHRLFAIEVKVGDGQITVVPVGKPYADLVNDLSNAPELKIYALDIAATRAPKEQDSLNIEGLAATPQGTLLIAFRNPIHEGKALIVPLENPLEVIQGKARPQFGHPILLSLGGLGIRSMEYSELHHQYFIIAGPYADEGDFKLYQWNGSFTETPLLIDNVQFTGLHPEALVLYPEERNKIQVLSDDGGRKLEGVECKDLPIMQQRFRSLWVSP
jgi:Protein of unknown function (DUF3616)